MEQAGNDLRPRHHHASAPDDEWPDRCGRLIRLARTGASPGGRQCPQDRTNMSTSFRNLRDDRSSLRPGPAGRGSADDRPGDGSPLPRPARPACAVTEADRFISRTDQRASSAVRPTVPTARPAPTAAPSLTCGKKNLKRFRALLTKLAARPRVTPDQSVLCWGCRAAAHSSVRPLREPRVDPPAVVPGAGGASPRPDRCEPPSNDPDGRRRPTARPAATPAGAEPRRPNRPDTTR